VWLLSFTLDLIGKDLSLACLHIFSCAMVVSPRVAELSSVIYFYFYFKNIVCCTKCHFKFFNSPYIKIIVKNI